MNDHTLRLPAATRYRFRFVLEEPMRPAPYLGSAWRGLLGHGLRRVACVTARKHCDGCPLLEACIYNRLFESRTAAPDAGRHRVRPHPFVLEPVQPRTGERLEAGDVIELGITLLSDMHTALPFLVQAMHQAGRRGLGRRGGRFRTVALFQETDLGSDRWTLVWNPDAGKLSPVEPKPMVPLEPPRTLAIELLTPLRMKFGGRLVRPETFSSDLFLTQLWRRIRDLAHHYGGGDGDPVVSLPQERPEGVETLDAALEWRDWTRYSSRQRCHMKMGGLVGRWRLPESAVARWWPLLWYGQWLHLGKGTSMGLGHYRLQEVGKLAVRASEAEVS